MSLLTRWSGSEWLIRWNWKIFRHSNPRTIHVLLLQHNFADKKKTSTSKEYFRNVFSILENQSMQCRGRQGCMFWQRLKTQNCGNFYAPLLFVEDIEYTGIKKLTHQEKGARLIKNHCGSVNIFCGNIFCNATPFLAEGDWCPPGKLSKQGSL